MSEYRRTEIVMLKSSSLLICSYDVEWQCPETSLNTYKPEKKYFKICLGNTLGKRRKGVNEKDVLLICPEHMLALIYAFYNGGAQVPSLLILIQNVVCDSTFHSSSA